jgi:hypothetical protein
MYAFLLTIMVPGQAPYQVQVGNAGKSHRRLADLPVQLRRPGLCESSER